MRSRLIGFLFVIAALHAQPVQQVLPNPDCQVFFALTTSGQASGVINNLQQGCTTWEMAYTVSGFSPVSVLLQSAANNGSGGPATFGTGFPVQQTILSGTNPGTSTTAGFLWVQGVNAFARVLMTGTGPGIVQGALFGWRIPNAGSSGSGGGITCLTGDVTAGSGSGCTTATVVGLETVPFCSGYTPTNGQFVQYTTGGSPNPCYTAASTPQGTVTHTAGPLTLGEPVFGNGGADIAVGTKTGNTTQAQMASGVAGATDSMIRFDSSGNAIGGSGLIDDGTEIYTTTRTVGIGTSTPGGDFQVVGASGNEMELFQTGGGTYMEFGTTTAGEVEFEQDSSGNYLISHSGVAAGVFKSVRASAVGDTLVLKQGNVGIGTGSPGYTLDVAGDINTSGEYRVGGSPAATTVSGQSCALGGSCTIPGTIPICSGSASTTAATCSTTPSFAPASGSAILFIPGAQNSGAFTLNVNSSSAAAVNHNFAALLGCELRSGLPVILTFNGTAWNMPNSPVLIIATTTAPSGAGSLNGLGSIGSASFATLTLTVSCAVSTDNIVVTPNASFAAVTGFVPAVTFGGVTIQPYPSAGNVNFVVSNWTASPLTISSGAQLNYSIMR